VFFLVALTVGGVLLVAFRFATLVAVDLRS
jgi:hypothetical protein